MNKNTLMAALSLACMEIKSRNEEAINSTWYRIYSVKNWFSARVSDDQKYPCNHRLYACMNTWKFKGFDSRKITSLKEIKKVIDMAHHFNHCMLITRPIFIQWKFTTPDHRSFANKDSSFFYHCSVHLFQSNQCFHVIEFVDRLVVEKL